MMSLVVLKTKPAKSFSNQAKPIDFVSLVSLPICIKERWKLCWLDCYAVFQALVQMKRENLGLLGFSRWF